MTKEHVVDSPDGARRTDSRSSLVVGLAVAVLLVAGWLTPAVLGRASLVQTYWLVLPGVVAAIRFGLVGAVVTSAASWCIAVPLALHRPSSSAGSLVGEAAFFVAVSATSAVLVRHVKQANDEVLALATEQQAAAVAAAEERGSLAKELQHRVNHDTLTDLANRQAFLARLEEQLRAEPDRTAVLFLDLDDFKTVNDTLGHAVGDELIIAVGQRLARSSRGHDLVARFGGDEFAILLADVGPGNALTAAQRIMADLKTPFHLCGRTLVVRASGGLAVSETSINVGAEQRALDLLKQADLAMYTSKVGRTRGVTVFHDGMQSDMQERLTLESDMQRALGDEQFFLEYQPLVDLKSQRTRAVEGLLRWQHPRRGLISPLDFIPVAEQTGMIIPLTLWVVRRAAAELQELDAHPASRGLSVALNVSGRFVVEPGVGAAMAREIHHSGVDPRRIILEITESLLMEDHETAVQTLCQLRAIGMRLSVDDFGTGYSSLSRLNTLPIDEVKIDRSFVQRLDTEPGRMIVNATVAMAHGLGLRVVAEGVESERQRDALVNAGCDDAQGFLFSRPVGAAPLLSYMIDSNDSDPGSWGVPQQHVAELVDNA